MSLSLSLCQTFKCNGLSIGEKMLIRIIGYLWDFQMFKAQKMEAVESRSAGAELKQTNDISTLQRQNKSIYTAIIKGTLQYQGLKQVIAGIFQSGFYEALCGSTKM